MSNAGSHTVYTAPKGETTEWDDIQRKLGNLPPLESEKEAEEDAPDVPTIDPYDLATAAELDELEEDEEFADTRFLDDYRQKRIAEMKEKAKTEKFGTVQNLVRADFVREVSDASKECWVVVHLHQDYVEKSNTLAQHLRLLAPKHKATKFLQIEADQCIEGYPDKNVPTVVIYHDGEMAERIVGMGQYGGPDASVHVGAVETDLEEDPRKGRTSVSRVHGAMRAGDDSGEDDE